MYGTLMFLVHLNWYLLAIFLKIDSQMYIILLLLSINKIQRYMDLLTGRTLYWLSFLGVNKNQWGRGNGG